MNHNPSVYQLKLTVRKGKKVKLSNYLFEKRNKFLVSIKLENNWWFSLSKRDRLIIESYIGIYVVLDAIYEVTHNFSLISWNCKEKFSLGIFTKIIFSFSTKICYFVCVCVNRKQFRWIRVMIYEINQFFGTVKMWQLMMDFKYQEISW